VENDDQKCGRSSQAVEHFKVLLSATRAIEPDSTFHLIHGRTTHDLVISVFELF
jgi:hypothetical protein